MTVTVTLPVAVPPGLVALIVYVVLSVGDTVIEVSLSRKNQRSAKRMLVEFIKRLK